MPAGLPLIWVASWIRVRACLPLTGWRVILVILPPPHGWAAAVVAVLRFPIRPLPRVSVWGRAGVTGRALTIGPLELPLDPPLQHLPDLGLCDGCWQARLGFGRLRLASRHGAFCAARAPCLPSILPGLLPAGIAPGARCCPLLVVPLGPPLPASPFVPRSPMVHSPRLLPADWRRTLWYASGGERPPSCK